MNLQEQGYRYVYRPSAHPECGIWIPPELMQPGDIDCTDMGELEFEEFLHGRLDYREVGE